MNRLSRYWSSLTSRTPVADQVTDAVPETPSMPAGLSPIVVNAAEALDRHAPGWHHVIDTSRLDMLDCETCILGQLGNAGFGPFECPSDPRGAFDGAYRTLRGLAGRARHWNGAFSGYGSDWTRLIQHRRADA